MVSRQARRILATVASALVATVPATANAHPLHTTFVEVAYSAKGEAVLTIKVFSDDFMRRVTRGAQVKPSDELALQKLTAAYLARTLLLNGVSGEAVPLSFCGWRRSADLVFICMKGPLKRGLAGLRIRDTILSEVFDDQVNVLQADVGGSRRSILFMNGSGVKELR